MSGSRIAVDPVLLMFAFRYALGRRTSAPSEVAAALIEHRDALPQWVRDQIVRDTTDAIEAGRAGGPCDVETWMRVLAAYGAAAA